MRSAAIATGGPSEPAGERGAPDLVIWATAASLLVLSLVISAAQGGWMWLLAAVMVPLLAGWVVLQRVMTVQDGRAHLQGRTPIVAILIATAAAVAMFCAVVAFAFQH